MSNVLLNSINQSLFPVVFKLLIIFLPIFLPIMLIIAWWILRYRWVTLKYIESKKTCLLEIRLPKEILKSPAGMEIFFAYLSRGGADNASEAFIEGKIRPWFSCEIVSIGGKVKFFIWGMAKYKNVMEAQLYAQYPNIEIYEVDEKDDYTAAIHFDMEKYIMYGVQYKLKKPDVYPIKTYIDFGLDKDPKDEYKIDPLASNLELLGSIKKGENIWMQILIQKHEKEDWKNGVMKAEARDIKVEHKSEVEKIRKAAVLESDDEEKVVRFPNPTKGQTEIIAALERSASKMPFDCMIRSMYIAEKDAFNSARISDIIGYLRHYNANNLNGFAMEFKTDISDLRKDITVIFPFFKKHFSFDIFDGFKSNEAKILEYKKDIFHAYKLRSFFNYPYKHFHDQKPFVMNTEELATIFHFPSGVVSQTPTLKRVGSKKSQAPSNLPI